MMIRMAARIVGERRVERGPDVRQLELGFARRKVELYEAMLAEELGLPRSTGTEADKLRDLLAGARPGWPSSKTEPWPRSCRAGNQLRRRCARGATRTGRARPGPARASARSAGRPSRTATTL